MVSLKAIYSIRDATIRQVLSGTHFKTIKQIRHINLSYLTAAGYIIDPKETTITIYNVKNPWVYQDICKSAGIQSVVVYHNQLLPVSKKTNIHWGQIPFEICQ